MAGMMIDEVSVISKLDDVIVAMLCMDASQPH